MLQNKSTEFRDIFGGVRRAKRSNLYQYKLNCFTFPNACSLEPVAFLNFLQKRLRDL
jgi:hypothetical protein